MEMTNLSNCFLAKGKQLISPWTCAQDTLAIVPVRKEVHLLKLLLLFATVTSGVVFVAVQMHGSGQRAPQEVDKVEAVSVLPVPGKSMQPYVAIPASVAAAFPNNSEVKEAIPMEVSVPTPPINPAPPTAPPLPPPPKLASLSITKKDIAEMFPPRPMTPDVGDVPAAIPLPPVYQAVIVRDEEWLAQALTSGVSPDTVTTAGDTALCAAVQTGYAKGVELLLVHGADVAKPGREGQPPLALAALKRNVPIVEALLRGGADPNTVFISPLHKELLEAIKQTELKSSLRSDSGVTVLMASAARGDVETTVALLKHGAKTSRHTKKYSRYAINFAAEQHYLFIMRILLGRSADSEPDKLVTIDLSQQKAWIAERGVIIDTTQVSTGREGFSTPAGRYVVTDKHESWTSTLYHVAMPYFMRLNCSAIGLHSGYVSGRPASHGCIRLPYQKAKQWFGTVKIGDEVEIVP